MVTEQRFEKSAIAVKVWGEFACFSRPEYGAERVSYPVITATAARGILESIFWKPQFRWQIYAIDVLNPIKWFGIQRNELKTRQTVDMARKWEQNGGYGHFDSSDVDRHRDQRNTLLLKHVAYIIHANVITDSSELAAKYRDQFRRRLQKGQYFSSPYLGCREFMANVSEPEGNETAIDLDLDLGRVLTDVHLNNKGHLVSAKYSPLAIVQGRVQIPVEGEVVYAS